MTGILSKFYVCSTCNMAAMTGIFSKFYVCSTCNMAAMTGIYSKFDVCSTCNVCILKREHHCMFAGYCVGHNNHRYFILFLGESCGPIFI